jgi:hypothetical protein
VKNHNSNGQFKKGNSAAKKKALKTILVNDAHKKQLPVEKKETDINNDEFSPFGDDNLFPQRTAELYRKSSINRSVITSKRNYVVGEGFETEVESFYNYEPNTDETLREINNKVVLDFLVGGNAYIEVVLGRNGVVNMYHKDHTKCRVHKDGKHIIIHPDWSVFRSKKSYAKTLPIYPMFERIDGFMRSIIHIRDYEAEFNHYGVPSNIGAIDSANINYKTNKWNLSRLENSFKLSGVLNVVANFSEEDAQTFQDKVTEKFSGESTQGKVMTIINELGGEGEKSTFTPIEANEDGNWTNLHEQAINEIIIANQWFRGLSGISDNTGFDTNRLRNEYQIAISTIIPYTQKFFLDVYQMVFNNHLNMNIDDLKIVNKSPISLVDLNNVHQAIIQINAEVAGRMSEDMAKATLKVSFQLTDEQLEDLFV